MASPSIGQSVVSLPLVQKPTFIGVVWGGTAIGTIALAFRYYVRIKCFRRLLADDFIAGFAWILLLATAILWQVIVDDLYEITEVSAGVRMPSLNFITNAERYLKGSLSVLFLFYVGLWTIKMNFLVFFYRLGDQITFYRIFWWIVTIFSIAAGLTCIGTIQYHCLAEPFEKVFQHCTGESAINFQSITLKVNCALDVFTDALIMAMPISVLWNVRISLRRKFALAGLFGLVIITMVVAVVRVTVVTGAAASSKQKQVEMTWLYMWHFIESSVALLVTCLASFRALFAKQERIKEAKEAIEREQADKEESGPTFRVIRARAKHFQNSLFDTVKSSDGTQTTRSNDMELPLPTARSDSDDTSQPDCHSIESISGLNSHGLFGSVAHQDVRR